jgi:hypothetical protein
MDAVVARSSSDGLQYLAVATGKPEWVSSTFVASRFQNVRTATRAALRLPARLRAFALPQFGTEPVPFEAKEPPLGDG